MVKIFVKWFKLFIVTSVGFFLLSGCHKAEEKTSSESSSIQYPKELKIGYQKSDTLVYLKKEKIFENAFEKNGVKVIWKEFPSGPPMLEALNSGGIDIASTGDTPPIFAQASGVDLVYIAADAPSPKTEAILIHSDANIKSVNELKNKKVAVTRGSSAHYTLLKALQNEGLTIQDINPVYFQPADGRAAFESKKVDAWVVWDPYLVAAELELKAIRLIDTTGLKPQTWFYLAQKTFADQYPYLIKEIIEYIEKGNQKIKANLDDFAEVISNTTKLPIEVTKAVVNNRNYGVSALDTYIETEQQKIADAFYAQKLIPKPIKIKDIFWSFK